MNIHDTFNRQSNSENNRQQVDTQISVEDVEKRSIHNQLSREYQRSYPQNNNEISSGFG